jgi:hypothetical protein
VAHALVYEESMVLSFFLNTAFMQQP